MAILNIVQKLVTWKNNLKGRKAKFLVFFVLIGVGLAFLTLPVLAQSTGSTSNLNTGVVSDNGFFSLDTILNIFSGILGIIARYSLALMMFVLRFVIEVASYNGYLGSAAVNNGWVLVRDLTNMIFVIALLAIAFGTILGVESYEWKKMLFKLISSAILVNFSRIICGILIDVAQVVMMTFLNGIAGTVDGNFIQAFNLTKIQSFSANVSGGNLNSASVFITALAACFVSVTILVVMCIMLAMLVARMIVLWVLIVLSPVAFVLGVLKKTEGYASEWWSEFGKNVITGPVLIFFIWLTLTTVGNGYAHSELTNYTSNTTVATYEVGGISEVLTGENLINFAIAIGMLLVGISVTKRLGGIGADWAGKAVDYGKKVTFAASGVMAARALASKGAEAVKSGGRLVLQKTPFIGTEAMARGVGNVKNYAVSKYIAPRAERKNLAIGEYMKKTFEGKTRTERIINRIKATGLDAITGSKYATDMAKKRDEEAKTKLEIAGRVSSSSAHPASKRLVEAESRLRYIKETGEKVKKSKEVGADFKRQEAFAKINEINKGVGTDQEKERMRADALREMGYNDTEIRSFEKSDIGRLAKATSSAVEITQQQNIINESERLRIQKQTEKLNQPYIYKSERSVKSGVNTDESSGVYSQADFAKLLDEQSIVGDLRSRLQADFNAGKEIKVPVKTELSLDGSEASLAAANNFIDQRVANRELDEKDAKKIKERLEYQNQDARLASLAVQNEQLGRALGKMSDIDKAKAEAQLRSDKGGAFVQREQRIAGFSAELGQRQDEINTEKQIELLAAIKELLSGKGGVKQNEINMRKAEALDLELENQNEKNLAAAGARDEYLRKNNRTGEATFVQQESDRQAKVRGEQQAIGSYPQAIARIKQQIATLEKLRNDSKASKKDIARAERTLGDMFYANATRHSAFGMGAMSEILKGHPEMMKGIGSNINLDNLRKLQAQMISTRLGGELVEASKEGLKAGMAKLEAQYKELYGEKNFKSRLQADLAYDTSKNEMMAGQGQVNYAGLTNTYVGKDGNIETRLTAIDLDDGAAFDDSSDDYKHVVGRRVAAKANSKITTIDGFGGSVDINEKGESTADTVEARDFIVNAIKPLKGPQLKDVEEYSKQSLAQVLMHSKPKNVEKLLRKLVEEVEGNALKDLLRFAKDRMKPLDVDKNADYTAGAEKDKKNEELKENVGILDGVLAELEALSGGSKKKPSGGGGTRKTDGSGFEKGSGI